MRLIRYLLFPFSIVSLVVSLSAIAMPIKSQLCKDVWWQSRLPKSVKNIDDMNPEHVELAGTSGFTTSPTDTALTSKNKAYFQDVLAEIPKDETQNHIAVSDTEDGRENHKRDSETNCNGSSTTFIGVTMSPPRNLKRAALQSFSGTAAMLPTPT